MHDPASQLASRVSPSTALPAALFLLAARHREHPRIMTVIRIVLPILKIPQFRFKTSLIKTLNFESPAWAPDNFSPGLQRTTRPVFRHPTQSPWMGAENVGQYSSPYPGKHRPFFRYPPPLPGPEVNHPKPPRRPSAAAQATGDRNSRQSLRDCQ